MPRILTEADIADFRSRLCDVAALLFAETGHNGFNMRELAKRLGVSAMTPYRYFEDKDAILAEVRSRAFARFAEGLEEALATGAERTTLPNAYAQFAIREQIQYRLMFDLGQPQTAITSAEERRARDAMAAHARSLVRHGVLSGDPELLALMLWSTLHGVTTLYLTGKLSSADFHRVLSNSICLFADGRACATQTEPDLSSQPWWPRPQSFEAVTVAGE